MFNNKYELKLMKSSYITAWIVIVLSISGSLAQSISTTDTSTQGGFAFTNNAQSVPSTETPSQGSFETTDVGQAIPVTQTGPSSNQTGITKSQEDLTLKMRELWAEHVIWTRMFIMSVADNTTDKAVVTTRLLKNYDDMADAMKPYYGNGMCLAPPQIHSNPS
jgi:hypothetical protein